MSKQPLPAPTASTIGPYLTVIQIVGRPGTGRLPSTITPPEHPYYRGDLDRIYHRSWMLIEKSQPEGKRMKPETRFTEFPALSVDPWVGISRSALETDD